MKKSKKTKKTKKSKKTKKWFKKIINTIDEDPTYLIVIQFKEGSTIKINSYSKRASLPHQFLTMADSFEITTRLFKIIYSPFKKVCFYLSSIESIKISKQIECKSEVLTYE